MSTQQDGPVTVVVRHRIKSGKETDFEEWLRGVSRAALQFDGHMGFNIIRPGDIGRPEYLVFFRFDNFAHLEDWENSEVRREWMNRLAPLSQSAPQRERHTGMEVWFTPPAGKVAPPRIKMVAVTILAVYPLVLAMQTLLVPYLMHWHIAVRTAVTSLLLVFLMTYAAMPTMVKVFSKWLYGAQSE